MKVAAIVEDAGLNKGVIVSKNGFTPDAVSFAKYKNIGLIELREPNEEDWKGRIKNIKIDINMLLPEIFGFELIVSEDTRSNLKPGATKVEFLEIKYPDGKIENIERFLNEFHKEF